MKHETKPLQLGSLFAGIGGFDLGFERAGWKTAWQVEKGEVQRLVLADRFADAKRFKDVRQCGKKNLAKVDCITAGFPCQDVSVAGNQRKTSHEGLWGEKSSLFFDAMQVVREVAPKYVVFENVFSLLSSNDGKDFETILQQFAESGYMGFWRVLNAAYFGVPQNRRRVFMVGCLGSYPPFDLLFDAGPMETLSGKAISVKEPRGPSSYAGHTLSASTSTCRIGLGCEVLVAEENGWGSMVKRAGISRLHGIPKGLDEINTVQKHCAGNAVVPAIAEWIARKLAKEIRDEETAEQT